jgi:hypothetical protein
VKEEIYVIKRLMNAYDVGQIAGDDSAIALGRIFLKENAPEKEITITPSKLMEELDRYLLSAYRIEPHHREEFENYLKRRSES